MFPNDGGERLEVNRALGSETKRVVKILSHKVVELVFDLLVDLRQVFEVGNSGSLAVLAVVGGLKPNKATYSEGDSRLEEIGALPICLEL